MASSYVDSQDAPVGQPGSGRERRGGRWVVLALATVGLVAAAVLVWSLLNQPAPTESSTVEPSPVVVTSGSAGQAGQGNWQTDASPSAAGRGSRAGFRPSGVAEASAPSVLSPQAVDASAKAEDEPAATAGAVAVAGTDGVDLWDAPGGALLHSLPTGAFLAVKARSQDGSWLLVQGDGGADGWSEASRVIGFSLDRLPVVEVAPPAVLPTNDPTTVPDRSPPPSDGETAAAPVAASSPVPADNAIAVQSAPVVDGGDDTQAVATVSLGDTRLNVRAGPGIGYAVIAKANPGDSLRAVGRDESSSWVQVILGGAEDGVGWVSADYVTLNGPAENLPLRIEIGDAPPSQAGESAAVDAAVTVLVAASSSAMAAVSSGLQGTLVFQSSHGGMIYAYDLTDGRLWPLTTGFDPAISPDGQRVAFTRDGGENGIYVIDIDGSDERLIFSGRATLASPKWSPDGAWIVFSRGDEYTECYDFGRTLCLTEDELPDRLPPGLLDDLTLVKQYKQKLAVVDANGGNYRDVAALESARTPDWSDQGIVYQSKAGIQLTADAAGAQNRLVSFDYLKPFYHDPDWQPGSERIAFMSKEGSHWEIFVVDADGTGMTSLTRPVTALVAEIPSNVAPAWSPDGQSIVYVSNRGDDNSAGEWRLWVMDADGSNQRPLAIDVAIDYTFGDEQAVSWGS